MVNTTKEQQVIEKLNKYVPFHSLSSSSSSWFSSACGAGNCSIVVEVLRFDRLIDDLVDEPPCWYHASFVANRFLLTEYWQRQMNGKNIKQIVFD